MPHRQLSGRAAAVAPLLALALTLLGTAPAAGAEESGVTRATLGNGLRVVIVHNSLAPVVATSVNYLAGSD